MQHPTNPNFTQGAVKFANELNDTINTAYLGISLFCVGGETLTETERMSMVKEMLTSALVDITRSLIRNMPEAVYADQQRHRSPEPSLN